MEVYPKLEDGGGYELLICVSKSRDLVLIGRELLAIPGMVQLEFSGVEFVDLILSDLQVYWPNSFVAY